MNIVELSIKKPVFAWVTMFSLIVFGGISLSRLGISQMPDVDFPILSISIVYEGASPEVVEAEILDKVEQRLASVEGIIEVKSSARSGQGSIQVEFDINKNIDVALQEVQTAISQIRMPEGVTEAPVISKQNPTEDPIMFIGFWADRPLEEVVEYLEYSVMPSIQGIAGVGEVSIGGFSIRNLRIWIDFEKLSQFDFTVTDLIDSIQQQHVERPLGLISNKKQEKNSRLMGEALSAVEFSNLPIQKRGGQIVHDRVFKIKDFARVEDGSSDVRRIAEVDGKNAVSLIVRKQRGTNEVEVAKKVRAYMDALIPALPHGYQARINVDYTLSTRATVSSTLLKLGIAVLVTIIVVFMFLGSLPASFNILLSIPTSIVGTFIVMLLGNFTLNLFSMLALALVVSIVVDDAIMVLENIIRHYRMNKSAHQAALDGTHEVLGATIAATLAVIAVFLPIVFMKGIIGKFFFQFGVVMSVAVALSLLDAVTITPMRASQMLSGSFKPSKWEHRLEIFFESLSGWYQSSLKWSLKVPLITIMISLAFFGSSLYLFKKIKKEFVPSQDQNFLIMSFQTQLDSALEVTYEKGKEIAQALKGIPEIKGFFISVGAGGPSSSANQGFAPLILLDQNLRKASHTQVIEKVRKALKLVDGVKVQIRDVSTRGLTSGRSFPVSFNLRGPDLEKLDQYAAEIIKKLESEGVAQELDLDYKRGIKEIRVYPKRDAMASRGVSMDAISRTLQTLVGSFVVGQMTSNGKRFDIRLKAEADAILSQKDFNKIYVRNLVGNLEPLSYFIEVREEPVVQSINRINRQRSISVFGNLTSKVSQQEALDKAQQIAVEILPAPYQLVFEGASSQFSESFKSITWSILFGLLVAYLILAIQYNSFVHPLSVLAPLPFAVIGAFIVLYFTSNSLNLYSLIGLIVLMGIAKKNSILLVEFANQTRALNPNLSIKEALAKSCPVRLRPILMTSVATMLAALPLLVKGGMGHEATSSMALTIVGGVFFSTLLTLYFVPVLYYYLSFIERQN